MKTFDRTEAFKLWEKYWKAMEHEWFIALTIRYYHKRRHTALHNMTPAAAYVASLMGGSAATERKR